MAALKPSELPLNDDGSVYHLALHSEEIADTILLVGDPSRVALISERFDAVEVQRQKREFVTHTGRIGNTRITALSTGIGADNIDIVMNELDALRNIDLKTREVHKKPQSLNLVRIGTCGALQRDIKPGSAVVATAALGFDSMMSYYRWDIGEEGEDMDIDFIEHYADAGMELLTFYSAFGDEQLVKRFSRFAQPGITASAAGFYGPQGRKVRGRLSFPLFMDALAAFEHKKQRVLNIEMECSAIYGLGQILGHRCATVCLVLANRATGEFVPTTKESMGKLVDQVLEELV